MEAGSAWGMAFLIALTVGAALYVGGGVGYAGVWKSPTGRGAALSLPLAPLGALVQRT